MGLLEGRLTYKPFDYEKAHEFWTLQQNVHWMHSEIPMSSDIQDWKMLLTEAEKSVVGGILKGFIQAEIVVNDYWTKVVGKLFPHPEIVMMASAFGNMESVHAVSYAYLNDSLGLSDYDAFLAEPTAKAKIDRILEIKNATSYSTELEYKKDIAKALAIFSAFTEGVSLYSSFAVLMSFSRFNKLKGVGQIISYSNRDEAMHAQAGCWLFREFIKENSEIWTDELKKEIYEAARVTVSLEDDFIDKVFENGTIEGIEPRDLKVFIRNRANTQLGQLGLKQNWKNLDKEALKRMEWFDYLTAGVEHQDFFAQRSTSYSKATLNFDEMW